MSGLLAGAGALWAGAKNREFAEEMSSTAYQRAVADMRAAGLSPNAIYGSGGGSPAQSPGASQDNPMSGIGSSAQQIIQARQQLATTEKTDAETSGVKAQAEINRANAKIANSNAEVIQKENTAYQQALGGEGGKSAAVLKKYGGGGAVGLIGSAGAAISRGAGSVLGGMSSAKGSFAGDSYAKQLGAYFGG